MSLVQIRQWAQNNKGTKVIPLVPLSFVQQDNQSPVTLHQRHLLEWFLQFHVQQLPVDRRI